jgi:hypothetical protein
MGSDSFRESDPMMESDPGWQVSILRMFRCLAVIALAVVGSTTLPAQSQAPARRILPEVRADGSVSDVDVLHFGGGFHVNSGTYMRLALLAGYGRAWAGEQSFDSYRVELQGRFHLDPARNNRFGLYGIGGILAGHDDVAHWQSRIVAGAGVELPAHARSTIALEMALAGGFRVSLAVRRLTLGRR